MMEGFAFEKDPLAVAPCRLSVCCCLLRVVLFLLLLLLTGNFGGERWLFVFWMGFQRDGENVVNGR